MEAHCCGPNMPRHILVVCSEEKLQSRESSQGRLLPQIVSQEVGMLFTWVRSTHEATLCSFRAEWVVQITKWDLPHLGVSWSCRGVFQVLRFTHSPGWKGYGGQVDADCPKLAYSLRVFMISPTWRHTELFHFKGVKCLFSQAWGMGLLYMSQKALSFNFLGLTACRAGQSKAT